MPTKILLLIVLALVAILASGCLSDYDIDPPLCDQIPTNDPMALFRAAEADCAVIARALIDRGADIEAASTLHTAAMANSLNVARLLIDRGAEVEARDKHGWTPLHRAAIGSSLDVARLLIDRGAEVDARTETGHTALLIAATKSLDVVRLLIDRGADIDAADTLYGHTSLHLVSYSISGFRHDIARLLIDRGADIEAKNYEGDTPDLSWVDNQ